MGTMRRKNDRNQGRVFVMRTPDGAFWIKAHKHKGRVTVPVAGPAVLGGSSDQEGVRQALDSAMDAFRTSYRNL